MEVFLVCINKVAVYQKPPYKSKWKLSLHYEKGLIYTASTAQTRLF